MARNSGTSALRGAGVCLLGALVVALLPRVITNRTHERVATEVSSLAEKLREGFSRGGEVNPNLLQTFVSTHSEVGFVVAAHFAHGYRGGAVNTDTLREGAPELERYRRDKGDDATFRMLLDERVSLESPYLRNIAVPLVPLSASNDRTPLGILKVGYVVPGYPFGPGYRIVAWGVAGLLVLLAVGIGMGSLLRTPLPVKRPQLPPADGLLDLERELESGPRVMVDEAGRSWQILFNALDLRGWRTQGVWYVLDGELVGEPWGGSIVSTAVVSSSTYGYRVEARKLAGDDGFILLFSCGGHSLAWVIGGWRNTRSELAGYENTRKEMSVELGKWYAMDIHVEAEELSGYLDGNEMWRLSRSSLDRASPSAGFLEGIGVAVWSTLTKFRAIQYSSGDSLPPCRKAPPLAAGI